MASTNFKIFNEEMSSDRTFSDSEYAVATQRQTGVIPGMALSRLHNKMYRQSSAMAKAIADFLVAQGYNCNDNDVPGITNAIQATILQAATAAATDKVNTHKTASTLDHPDGSVTDAKIGNRTITDTTTAAAGAANLTTLLSMLGYVLKNITGKSNWYTLPALTLESVNALFGTAGHAHTGAAGQGPKIAYGNITGTPSSLPANGGNADTATNASNHIAASSGAHAASAISSTATGNISATNVQAAIAELDGEKQPLDTTLTALAALSTAANQMIYSTGSDTFAMATLTAFARTLLDDTDAATARTTLGAAPLASPALTGTPTAPTAAAGTNTTQLATTAFVQAEVASATSIVASGTGTGYYWRKWSNGDVEIWGKATALVNTNTNVSFPVAFTAAIDHVGITMNNTVGGQTWGISVSAQSLTGFTILNPNTGGSSGINYYAKGR